MRERISIIAITILISAFGIQAHAYNITSFDTSVYSGNTPSDVASLDAAVGIATNYKKEDFSDSTLMAGLSISFENYAATSVLSAGRYFNQSMSWDSGWVLATNISLGDTVFFFNPGANSIGVGIGDLEVDTGSDMEIFINGSTSLGLVSELPGFVRHNEGREVYLRVDVESGDDMIHELRFTQIASGVVGDGVRFDRLAVSPVPLPAAVWLFGSALVGIFGIRKRSQAIA